ncbi:unnamed protein product [Didymodactylos carnosus]|uniref:Transferase family protein n=1 Tax=Didymodactylos carnosus TaxID=1234261 RepID=A0A814QDS5_9BILA|nr:unnamed protein product [Didymodactylos carnosus]CAF1117920.1 unnamed protein product [Didymodactylos carnosus]CAF3696909.1 unnamed protein product [Didymodactylos carnosus]CAF3881692.1 unnamed protein product [Didymodactylos carnosus]
MSVSRVFPESHLKDSSAAQYVPLSILDSTVGNFAPTCATWIYDPPNAKHTLSTQQLLLALQRTLNAYPHWAGQLQLVHYNATGDHTQRFGRLSVLYGIQSDPGVEVIIAHRPETISSFVPTATQRTADPGWWNAAQAPLLELVPASSPLALHDLIHYEGLPAMMVQFTTFGCGGLATSIKLAHPLADAQTLINFVHDWAAVNRALITGEQLPSLCPLFDPGRLDRAASGNIDAPEPDPRLIKVARDLPLHYYDLWASSDDCPPSMAQATKIPAGLNTSTIIQGNPLPWLEWDHSAPVSHYLVSFTADELKSMWEEASSDSEVPISRLDALLAHVWILIIRARGLSHDQQPIYLDVTLGVRSRLSSPLPETFVGSPIMLAKVTTTGVQSIGKIALSIRSTLSKFNSSSIAAMLHDFAFEISPHRLWNAFLGRRNTIVTSWLRLNAYGVDFGTGEPRFVDAFMPNVDGCVQLMENGNVGDTKKSNWYDGTVNVSLHLRTDVMEKLLDDPELRKYRNNIKTY